MNSTATPIEAPDAGRQSPAGLLDTMAFSAADSRFFGLLRDLVHSLGRAVPELPLAVFDLGLEPDQRAWLQAHGIRRLQPKLHFGLSAEHRTPQALSLMVRPFLPEYVPNRELYLWLDADTWVQERSGIDRLCAGARNAGMAVVHEGEPCYRFQLWLEAWTWKHALRGCGLTGAIRLRRNRQVNAGVYCIRRDTPHWELWQVRFRESVRRTGQVAPYDQFSLNEMIYSDKPSVTILDPGDNWICDRAVPMWDQHRRAFVNPRIPWKTVSIMHLAGPAKAATHRVPTVCGGFTERSLKYMDPTAARQASSTPDSNQEYSDGLTL